MVESSVFLWSKKSNERRLLNRTDLIENSGNKKRRVDVSTAEMDDMVSENEVSVLEGTLDSIDPLAGSFNDAKTQTKITG